MSKGTQNLLTAIDVGSAKTCALTAEITEQGLRYRGHGIAESRGTRKGLIVEIDRAAASVQAAVQQAEDLIGAPVERAVVGIAGPHIRGINSEGAIALGTRPREINRDDVRQVTEKARGVMMPADRKMLHLLVQEFIVDGQDGIHADPIRMVGTRLAIRAHVVTALRSAEQNVVTVVNRAGIEVEDEVFEPLATADAVLRSDERELGVCLCDIGAGSTELVVFCEGSVAHTGVVPIGGDHFTNDIAVGLRTPLSEAEKIKRLFGCAVVTQIPEANEIEVPSVGDRPSRLMSQRLLGEILEPRARELFEMIRDHLRQAGVFELCGTGLVLTGGASRLPGMLDVIDQVMRRTARVGGALPIAKAPATLLEPEYSAVVGLLTYAYRMRSTRSHVQESANPLARLKALFAKKGF